MDEASKKSHRVYQPILFRITWNLPEAHPCLSGISLDWCVWWPPSPCEVYNRRPEPLPLLRSLEKKQKETLYHHAGLNPLEFRKLNQLNTVLLWLGFLFRYSLTVCHQLWISFPKSCQMKKILFRKMWNQVNAQQDQRLAWIVHYWRSFKVCSLFITSPTDDITVDNKDWPKLIESGGGSSTPAAGIVTLIPITLTTNVPPQRGVNYYWLKVWLAPVGVQPPHRVGSPSL